MTLKSCLLFQIVSLKANVNYLHENIMECQQNIVQMEQAENPEEEGEEGITKIVNLQVNSRAVVVAPLRSWVRIQMKPVWFHKNEKVLEFVYYFGTRLNMSILQNRIIDNKNIITEKLLQSTNIKKYEFMKKAILCLLFIIFLERSL